MDCVEVRRRVSAWECVEVRVCMKSVEERVRVRMKSVEERVRGSAWRYVCV